MQVSDQDFLSKLSQLEVGVELEVVNRIDNVKFDGAYLSIKGETTVFMVARDKVTDHYVVEVIT